MFNEQPIIVTTEAHLVETLRPEQIQLQSELATPSPEQIAAANGVFAQDREAQQVANLLGLWTSAALMHQIVVDTFDTREEEAEEKLRRARELERPGPQV